MKIVIYVDYSNAEFNKDFVMSNLLLGENHNVFLAVNNFQFENLKHKCDLSLIGHSMKNRHEGIELSDVFDEQGCLRQKK